MATLHRSVKYASALPTYEELQYANTQLNAWVDTLEAKVEKFEQDPKAVVEFNRYKQDCRKRALEMAHHEQINLIAASNAMQGGKIDIMELADKYYKWLISIPE